MSNLSGVDWQTFWSAVQGTAAMAALWFALIQVFRDSRAQRRRSQARLAAARSVIHTTVETLVKVADTVGEGKASMPAIANSLMKTSLFEDMIRQIEAIPLHEIDDSEAVDALIGARAALKMAAYEFGDAAENRPFHEDLLPSNITRLQDYRGHLDAAVHRAR